jgi:hypothetical protein
MAILAIFTMLPGCATVNKSVKSEASRTHYTLRYGNVTKAQWPLPDMTPIYIDWHHVDGHTESKLGFRSYDMNHDGTMDYLEVLAEDGTVATALNDFDFDGRPDRTVAPQTKN